MLPAQITVSVEEPYIVVCFAGEVSDEAHDLYLASLLKAISRRTRGEKSIILNDARAGFKGSTAQHRRQASFSRQHAALYRDRIAAVAFVVQDAFVASVLSSMLKLTPGPVPTGVHLSVAEAKSWASNLVSPIVADDRSRRSR